MSSDFTTDSVLEMFVFESSELITQLEDIALDSEETNAIETQINEVFRIVHTIKGTAAMMEFNNISSLAHSLEDVFFFIRENNPEDVDYSTLIDVVLKSTDYIKNMVALVQSGELKAPASIDDEGNEIVKEIKTFLSELKGNNGGVSDKESAKSDTPAQGNSDASNSSNVSGDTIYKVLLFFEDGAEMENVRAFNVVKNLENIALVEKTIPNNILEEEDSIEKIRQNGLYMEISSNYSLDEINSHMASTLFLKEFNVEQVNNKSQTVEEKSEENKGEKSEKTQIQKVNDNVKKIKNASANVKQSMISVNLGKLDKLMDLVGELVISQEMVVQNSELEGLVLNDFYKATRQLRKVANDIQDAVMSIRMVPISGTFKKMQRIVRDMSKKLDKEVKFETIGENTEVDKNVIEHLTDPLMHIIRNCMDHGIETAEDRKKAGKPEYGTVTLEAKDDGGDVCIIIKDDGRGLNKEKILEKAKNQGLVDKKETSLTDKEIYSLIFLPGFSTKKSVTEFSGRGVGMDVVNANMSEIGGKAIVDSKQGVGTTITLKIPLTLAIIEGMKIKIGNSIFVIPITSIKESFRVDDLSMVIDDINGREMVMLRGECIPLLRLHDYYNIKTEISNLQEGIIIVVENDNNVLCLFADEVIGEQQVVVKAMPKYIKNVKGVCGCTVMGDGSVCLISDVAELFKDE